MPLCIPCSRRRTEYCGRGSLLFLCELHPYRQICGAQAQFQGEEGLVLVEAYPHAVSDYVNAALESGFDLVRLGEWQDSGVGSERVFPAAPRLLSMLFRRPRA